MASSDFDFKNLLNTVRSTINPEYAIPKDKMKHPVNFRITRIRNLIGELHKAQQMLSAELSKMDTQISALIEEVQPYLNDEKKVSEAEIVEAAKEDGTASAAAASTGEASTEAKPEATAETGTEDSKPETEATSEAPKEEGSETPTEESKPDDTEAEKKEG